MTVEMQEKTGDARNKGEESCLGRRGKNNWQGVLP